MKFQFDFTEMIKGSVEILAECVRHAEEIFDSMTKSDLLEASDELRSQGVDTYFIDNRMTGMVTHQEWKSGWNMTDRGMGVSV